MMKRTRLTILAALGCTGALSFVILPVTPAAAIPVFDATNYAQNVVQAARALEQINHQLTSLQNEATMLQNMARNLERIDFPQLSRMTAAVKGIDTLMGEARSVGFEVSTLDRQLDTLFPGTTPGASEDQRVIDARRRYAAALEGYRQAMKVQASVVANVRGDADLLEELVGRSQDATGALQAQQATNQLLALGAKQQFQLQELMVAEFRSQSTDRARHAQEEEEARAATRRFLGTGPGERRH